MSTHNPLALAATTYVFQNIQFDIVDRDDQPWLRSLQIGGALGYKNPNDAINKLYSSNADEFTDSMTALVTLDSSGGKQQTRIFSLRGAHLLAMFARTEKAKAFRHWLLDLIDQHKQLPAPTLPPGTVANVIDMSLLLPFGKRRYLIDCGNDRMHMMPLAEDVVVMTKGAIERNIADLFPDKRLVNKHEWALVDTFREIVLKGGNHV